VKNPKCLNFTSTKIPILLAIPIILIIPTVLIQPILLAMCGITARSPTKIPEFWPGYPPLNPRHGTMTSEPVGLRRWETGSYKLRNTEIGSVVPAVMGLIVQPCFVTEIRGLGRPTLGKGEDTGRKRGIANKLE